MVLVDMSRQMYVMEKGRVGCVSIVSLAFSPEDCLSWKAGKLRISK